MATILLHLLFLGHQSYGAFCVGLDHVAIKEHWVMFDAQPGFDEVVIVLAGGMPGLSWCMNRERGFHIREIDDLAERWHCDHDFGLVGQARSHIDGIYIAADGKWTAIEDLIERFDGT